MHCQYAGARGPEVKAIYCTAYLISSGKDTAKQQIPYALPTGICAGFRHNKKRGECKSPLFLFTPVRLRGKPSYYFLVPSRASARLSSISRSFILLPTCWLAMKEAVISLSISLAELGALGNMIKLLLACSPSDCSVS